MRRRALLLFSLAGLIAPLAAARGENLLDLRVEYTADSVVGTGNKQHNGRLWRTPTALRSETIDGKRTHTVIVRFDRGIAWVLLPELKILVETTLDGLDVPIDVLRGGAGVKQSVAGRETIEGIATTRYRVSRNEGKGPQFDGHVWRSAQGIIMKVDGEGAHLGQRGQLRLAFRNVRIGPQDPALFEPPAGYSRMAVAGADLRALIESLQQLSRSRRSKG